MVNKITFTAFLIFYSLSTILAQVDFGVNIGNNFATQTFYDPQKPDYGQIQYDNLLGLNIGAWISKNVSQRSIVKANFNYQKLGYKEPVQTGNIHNGVLEDFHDLHLENRYNYLSLDLDYAYHFGKGKFKPFLIAGLRNGYLLSFDPNYKIDVLKDTYPYYLMNDFKKYVLGWKAGIGVKLKEVVALDFTFNRDITPVLKKANLETKNWFWSLNVYFSIGDLI